jgi:antitoxin component of MazEF toxin-antitoxin module
MHATKLHKYRNATGVTLNAKVLKAAGLAAGDSVTISVKDGVVEIRKLETEEAMVLEGIEIAMARYAHALRELAK